MIFNNIKYRPSDFFEHPKDILRTEKMTIDEKEQALKTWRETCLQEERSMYEGLEGDISKVSLRDVDLALEELRN